MKKNFWERNIGFWENHYYLHPVWFCCMLIALYAGIKHYKNEKINLFFLLYIISGLLLFIITQIAINFTHLEKKGRDIIIEITNTFFSIIEISVFFYFFYKTLNFKRLQGIMVMSLAFILVLSAVFFINIRNPEFPLRKIMKFSYNINVVEFIFLLFPCLAFFYNILNGKKSTTSPSLWITTGLFFYITISLPFLLIGNTLSLVHREFFHIMFSIHFLSISILFLCIAKAFSCKAPLTT